MLPESLPRRLSSKEDLPLGEESLPSKESVREDLLNSEDCPSS